MFNFKKLFKSLTIVLSLFTLLLGTSTTQAYSEQYLNSESTLRSTKPSLMDGGGYGGVGSYINLSNYSIRLNNGSYRHVKNRHYTIERDHAYHRQSYWKMKYRGYTVASITRNGKVVNYYGKYKILP